MCSQTRVIKRENVEYHSLFVLEEHNLIGIIYNCVLFFQSKNMLFVLVYKGQSKVFLKCEKFKLRL